MSHSPRPADGHLMEFTQMRILFRSLLALAIGLSGALPRDAIALGSNIAPYCTYQPDWPVYLAGDEVVQHAGGHSGKADQPGTTDVYQILMPRVTRSVTIYNRSDANVPLKQGDEVVIDACGCVQTGGKGRTWKSYVDPKGDHSDRLYHGLILIPNAAALGLRTSPMSQNFVRIVDLIAAEQNPKFKFIVTGQQFLTLGYEDDGYADNGYSAHDDGNDDQCRNVGAAAVSVTIKHH